VKVETDADLEVSDKEWQEEDGDKMMIEDDSGENAAAGVNGDRHVTTTESQGLSDYKINKAKNVADLRRKLAEVEKNYPLPEEFRVMKEHRKPGSSKKGKAPQEEAVRRESRRIKDQAK